MLLCNAKALLVSALGLSASLRSVVAFPSGAGGCSGGQAAVGGSHIGRSPQPGNGPITEGGLFVTVDDADIATVTFTAGQPYQLDLGSGAVNFRGFLFRFSAAEGLTAGPTGGAQAAAVCTGDAVGVTHSDNSEKEAASAVLMVTTPGTYSLDVTVVGRNCGPQSSPTVGACTPADSTYWYQGYEIIVAAPPTKEENWDASVEQAKDNVNEAIDVEAGKKDEDGEVAEIDIGKIIASCGAEIGGVGSCIAASEEPACEGFDPMSLLGDAGAAMEVQTCEEANTMLCSTLVGCCDQAIADVTACAAKAVKPDELDCTFDVTCAPVAAPTAASTGPAPDTTSGASIFANGFLAIAMSLVGAICVF